MSQVCVIVFAFLGFVIGGASATCTEVHFIACLTDVEEIWPSCNITEIDYFCSRVAASRQCLANISCSVGDVGYTEVKRFGNFSKYTLVINEMEAVMILCDSRLVLSNPNLGCVFTDLVDHQKDPDWYLLPFPDLNAVSWIGDHCGFLRAYYERKYTKYSGLYNDAVAEIVLNATLKLYELQQQQCPPFDGKIRYDETTLWACLSPIELAQSPSECDTYCSEVNKMDACITNLNLSTWDAGYSDFPRVGMYFSNLHYMRSFYVEGAQCACENLAVLKSSCLWIDAQYNYNKILQNYSSGFDNISAYEELCSLLNKSYEQFYADLIANGNSENVARTLQTCTKKSYNFAGCNSNETVSMQTTSEPTSSRTSITTAGGATATTNRQQTTAASSGYGLWSTWSPCAIDCTNRKSNRVRYCATGNSCPIAQERQTLNCLTQDCTESDEEQPQGVILVTTSQFSKKIESNQAELSNFYTKVDNKINGFCSRNTDRKKYCCKYISADVTINTINPLPGTLEIVTGELTSIGSSYPRETGNVANVKLLFRADKSVLVSQCSVGSSSTSRAKRQSTGSIVYLNKTLMAEALNESVVNANESDVLSVSPAPDFTTNKTSSDSSSKSILYVIILPMIGVAVGVTLFVLAARCLQRSRSKDVKKPVVNTGQQTWVPPVSVRDYYQPGYSGYGYRSRVLYSR